MNWKEFFRPTIGKLILPLFFFVWIVYFDLFAPLFCGRSCPSILERLVSAITNLSHIIVVLAVMLILYFGSCSVAKLVKKK